MDLRNAKIGVGKDFDTDLLILHPRNNNDSLLIVLDEAGQAIRLAVLEVKAWLEFYRNLLENNFEASSYVPNYRYLDHTEEVDQIYLNLRLKKGIVPSDGFIFRFLHLRAPMILELNLGFIPFTNDGNYRLKELLLKASNLQKIQFQDNYLDDIDMQDIFKSIFESGMLKSIKEFKIVKNKLNDETVLMLFDELGKVKSDPESSHLENLTLSGCSLGDSSLLGLDTLLSTSSSKNCFELDLSENLITENGLLMISELLLKHQVVDKLNLARCLRLDPTKNSLKSLLENLLPNKRIISIDFSGNELIQKSYKTIVNFLATNKSLQRLMISYDKAGFFEFRPSHYSLALDVFRFTMLNDENKKIIRLNSLR